MRSEGSSIIPGAYLHNERWFDQQRLFSSDGSSGQKEQVSWLYCPSVKGSVCADMAALSDTKAYAPPHIDTFLCRNIYSQTNADVVGMWWWRVFSASFTHKESDKHPKPAKPPKPKGKKRKSGREGDKEKQDWNDPRT